MPKYTLHYFDLRGRGEVIRLIFAQANVDFVDRRISVPEWPTLKPQMPFGQVPILEVDGTTLAQSTAIARYLANEFGLVGKSNLENARIDMLVELIEESRSKYIPWVHILIGFASGDKEKSFATVKEGAFLTPARYLEKVLKESKSGWLVGDSLTWVDLLSAEFFDKGVLHGDAHLLDDFPSVKAHIARVFDQPNMKRHVVNRPDTAF